MPPQPQTTIALIAVLLLLQWVPHQAQVTAEVVADLTHIGAAVPLGGLIRGLDGALYGTTNRGGASNCGMVYRLRPDHSLSVLHSFDRAQGCHPVGDLALGLDGHLYGTTYQGGNAPFPGLGTIFAVALDGTLRMLHSFAGPPEGSGPYAGLTLGPDGWFYGTTTDGSARGGGLVFRVSTRGSFQVVSHGITSQAALTLGSDGSFYGTSYAFSVADRTWGTVFRLSPAGALTTLHAFPLTGGTSLSPSCPCPDGAELLGEVVEGPDRSLYGTTSREGPRPGDRGTVFKVSADGTFTTLFAFSPDPSTSTYTQGAAPWAGLTIGTDGNLYGTASAGGAGSNGGLFRVSSTGSFTLLQSFEGVEGNAGGRARLFAASPGRFYGVTSHGQIFTMMTVAATVQVAAPPALPR